MYSIDDKYWLIVCCVALLLVMILNTTQKMKKADKKKLKELKWGKRGEVHGVIFGRKGKKVMYSPIESEGSVLCTAGTGMGKTSSLLIPTLRSWVGTSLTIDIGSKAKCTGYTEWLMTPVYSGMNNEEVWKWELHAVTEEAPSTGGQSDTVPHTHSFEWTVTKEPTSSENGLEEYKCKGCGAVEASQPISMYMFRVKELYGLVKDAPKGGAVAYDFGNLATISDYILAKMAERNDVAVTVSFTYNGEAHSITFPAGTDYTELLNDSEQFYGLIGLNGRYGISVSTIGSGV